MALRPSPDGAIDPRVDRQVQQVGALLAGHLPDIASAIYADLTNRVTHLKGDPVIEELLLASTLGNLENVAHLIQGHTQPEDIQPPAPAVEYARRLAQREVPLGALLRAYRLGQRQFIDWANDQLTRLEDDADLAYAASRELTTFGFEYIDRVSEALVEVYQVERDLWLANRNTVRLEVVEKLVAGQPVDVGAAEAALGHRLRQHHLGVIVWRAQPDTRMAGDLDQVVDAIARSTSGTGRPLVIPQDTGTAWAWIPLGRQTSTPSPSAVAAAVEACGPGVRAALGVTSAGEGGFRTSILDARRAHEVAMVAGGHARAVTSYDDPEVRTAWLLTQDLESTRRLVASSLRGLAEDSEGAERLRATLHAFLRAAESYVVTAERLHLHKNTVRYRVAKALESRGVPLTEDRLELELALVAAHHLGPRVLQAPGD
ncbi:PucR-like helix-turn-helix protein [Nocardioides sp. J9]|uniref:PucR family transcriptional regulator n=1 Tax=Nocardioides sp. J9 TaxID=935844 RepID=UPI0011A5B1AE|nr:helix-turn-helix domain-containing protein [Nocardioides sp. J9]TWG91540.1 PucR-like helix-turn-helix protein [Nocardioides sp. J9]